MTTQLTPALKQKVVQAILKDRPNFQGSDAKYATSLGIHKAQFSQLKSGKIERLLSDANWISIARRLHVTLGDQPEWVVAATPVFRTITAQLELCQQESANGIFCDHADIGKTVAAKEYVRTHANAIYVDCSLVKSKQKLVRKIAREFGVDHQGKYNDVFEDLVYYLKAIANPLIILDEGGDLDYPAFLELKALWNATEHHCGWYMIGADGLKAKWDRGIAGKKVGFAEIFRRYGAAFQSVVPAGDGKDPFFEAQAGQIIRANMPGADVDTIIRKCRGSLTRIRTEVIKLKRQKK